MDSYTLFGHVVDVAGIITCQRAHIELQALGVLPEASLENNPPLKQEDADARAALALWCGHQAANRELECFQGDKGAADQFAAACVKIVGSIAGSNSLKVQ
ncbi:hypothetical protein OAF30_03045 [Flavobacteriales bacterium]|nr:hypothetical protein [Flavobacteriales bacterium]